jgi:hypothetical protein
VSNVELDGHIFGIDDAIEGAAAVVVVVAVVAYAAATDKDVSDSLDAAFDSITSHLQDVFSDDDEESEPEPESTPRAPRPAPSRQNRGGCSGGGWVKFGDTDSKNGNRATGVTACLTKSYLASHKGSATNTKVVAPPGYRWAQRTARWMGLTPKSNINACHLLGNQLSGSGTDLRNLATCARGANDWQTGSQQGDNNMKNYENQVAAAVAAGQDVYYKVTPTYSGRRTVPTGFRIDAYGTFEDGTPGLDIDGVFISNTLGGRNLGMFNDPNTGRQVPTGSMS